MDMDGKYDPIGVYAALLDSTLYMKYPGQTRLCLGMAAVQLHDGTNEVRQCAPLDLTGKQVLTFAEYKKQKMKGSDALKAKDEQVRLGGNMREPGVIWDEELLSNLKVKGLGKATVGKILAVSNVKNLTSAEIRVIVVTKENKITKKILTDLRDAFVAFQPGLIPDCIILDHQKAGKPYLSRYGADRWK
jgi:hypothetical protein